MKGKNKRSFALVVVLAVLAALTAGCRGGLKVELDPESEAFFETARLIMSKEEKDIFTHLPDSQSREEFISDFWAKRDPDPGTEENEFKEEFSRRIEYANQRFIEGIEGWNTDRGRIYIYFGGPDSIESQPFINDPEIKGALLWVYYRFGFAVQFIDKRGDGSYTFDPYYGVLGDFFDALERVKLGLPLAEDKSELKFVNFNLRFDSQKREASLSIPIEKLSFTEEEGSLAADFDFIFYVYNKSNGRKQTFQESRPFKKPEKEVLSLKEIVFRFSFPGLPPGKYYFDVIVTGKPEIGKARKIFEIKI